MFFSPLEAIKLSAVPIESAITKINAQLPMIQAKRRVLPQ